MIPFRTKGISWLADFLTEDEYSMIMDYLETPEKYQKINIQNKLKKMAEKKV